MDNFVSFDGLGSTFLHNIYGSSKGRIRTDLIGEDLDFILELMKDRGLQDLPHWDIMQICVMYRRK